MVDFSVEKSGRTFSFPEVGCVVGAVKPIRKGRFYVTGDCSEAGDTYETSFFLDVNGLGSVSVDGTDLQICPSPIALQSPPVSATTEEWDKFNKTPVGKLCRFVTVRPTHYYWSSESDDPKATVPTDAIATDTEILVYHQEKQEQLVGGPKGLRLVAEFKGYYVPYDDLRFVGKCGPSR